MHKKILSGILALSMLCGTAFMVACEKEEAKNSSNNSNTNFNPNNSNTPQTPSTPPVDNRPVDTYEGYVSEETYQSESLAAQAYLDSELKGEATLGSLVTYDIFEEELTEEELSSLNLGDKMDSILSVRKMRVQYADKNAEDIKEKVIYIIANADGTFQYGVRALATGDTLLSSYYDLIAKNTLAQTSVTCTVSNTQESTIKIEDAGYVTNTSVKSTSSFTWQFTADMAYCKGTSAVDIDILIDGESATQKNNVTMEEYIVRDPSNPAQFVMLMRVDNGSWTVSSYPLDFKLDSIAPTDPNYLMASNCMLEFATADHSYFEKTSTGFKMSADKLQAYSDKLLLPMVIETLEEKFGEQYTIDVKQMILTYAEDSFVDYYLKANMLDKYDYVNDCHCAYPSLGMTMDMRIDGTVTYSNYSSTVINVPADVQEIIDNL